MATLSWLDWRTGAPRVMKPAQALLDARGTKPITAIANTLAASAAYWLATAADELVVTPSAEIGSIGVFAAHRDFSVALHNAGLKTTLISAGKYKVEANPFEPLSAEARVPATYGTCTPFWCDMGAGDPESPRCRSPAGRMRGGGSERWRR